MGSDIPGSVRAMIHGTGTLGGKILEQGSAHGDVDELNAAADSQDGQLPLPSYGEQGELEEIALSTRRTQQRRRLSPVPGRLDILSPGEQKTICAVERSRQPARRP